MNSSGHDVSFRGNDFLEFSIQNFTENVQAKPILNIGALNFEEHLVSPSVQLEKRHTPLKIKMEPKNKGLEDDFTTRACFLRIQADCRSSSIGGTPLKLNLLWSVIWGWQQRYGLPRQASHHLLWTWTSTWRQVCQWQKGAQPAVQPPFAEFLWRFRQIPSWGLLYLSMSQVKWAHPFASMLQEPA